MMATINKLRPKQNDRFADDSFKCISLNDESMCFIRMSLKYAYIVQLVINQHWFRQKLGAEETLFESLMN